MLAPHHPTFESHGAENRWLRAEKFFLEHGRLAVAAVVRKAAEERAAAKAAQAAEKAEMVAAAAEAKKAAAAAAAEATSVERAKKVEKVEKVEKAEKATSAKRAKKAAAPTSEEARQQQARAEKFCLERGLVPSARSVTGYNRVYKGVWRGAGTTPNPCLYGWRCPTTLRA